MSTRCDGTPIGDGWNDRTTEYDIAGRTVAEIDDNGNRETRIWDAAGRLSAMIDEMGNENRYHYDGNSNIVEKERREFDPSTGDVKVTRESTAFDELDRTVSRTDAYGKSSSSYFDSLGRIRKAVGRDSSISWTFYDQIGRTILTHRSRIPSPGPEPAVANSADGYTTLSWTYDKGGRVNATSAETWPASIYTYDVHGRNVMYQDPDGRVIQRAFDKGGNVVRYDGPDGSVVLNAYDSENRLIQRDIQRGPGIEGPTRETYAFDGTGRLIRGSAFKGAAESVRSDVVYTSLGGQEAYTQTVFGARADGGDWYGTTTRNFDASGRMTTVQHPAQAGVQGPAFSYTYDVLNRVQDVIVNGKVFAKHGYQGSRAEPVRTEYFSRSGATVPALVKSVELEGKACVDCGEVEGERIKRIDYSVPGPLGYAVERFEYAYDDEGRVVSESTLSDRKEFTYNRAGEMDSATMWRAGHALFDTRTDYSYNQTGSLTQKNVISGTGAVVKTTSYAVDSGGMGAYTSIDGKARSHDSAGRLVDDGKFKFGYDYVGRATSYSGTVAGGRFGTNGSYIRDPFGRSVINRQSRKAPGGDG